MKKFIKSLLAVVLVMGSFAFAGQALAFTPSFELGSAVATNITTNSATLNATFNPNGLATTAWFEIDNGSTHYGTTSLGSGSGNQSYSYTFPNNLVPNSTHSFRAVAQNSDGTTSSFPWKIFSTLPNNAPDNCPAGMIGTPPNCTWPANQPSVNLTANPSTIQQGASSTLSWSVTDATSCFASGGWSGNKNPNGGTQSVSPNQTTTYTLVCTGPGGTGMDSATVVVNQVQQNPPTVTLTANPTSIQAGQSSTLTWSVSNATSCTAGGGWSGVKSVNGGSTVVFPFQTTIYTINCLGNGGSTSDSVTVTVTQPQSAPTVTLTANPNSVSYNGSTILTWSATNATSCVANSNPLTSWVGNKSATGGTQVVSGLTSTTFFNIFCTGPGGSDSATVTVTVGAQPVSLPTVNLTANPTSVTSGGSTLLSWTSTNATFCTASSSNSQWNGTKVTSDSMQVSNLTSTTTFSITCTNSAGSASDSVTVGVVSQPIPQNLTVITNPATGITSNSGVLNGYVDFNGTTGTRWFEWSTTNSFLSNSTTRVYQGSATSFSETLFGLPSNTIVYFRAAAQNNVGTIQYGATLSFVTTGNIIISPCSVFGSCLPTAITTFATNIGVNSARLNGLGLQNNTNVALTGYFEWGETQALGRTTPSKFIGGTASNPFSESVINQLRANTTYFYRAVVTNQYGVSRGDIVSFRTGTGVILGVTTTTLPGPSIAYRNTTLVTNTNIATNVSKPSLLFLDTNCNNQIVQRGDTIQCTITWKNATNSTNLNGVLLRVGFPKELEFVQATTGVFSSVDNAVIVDIGNLAPGQEGSMTFTTKVRMDAEFKKIVIASQAVYSYIGEGNDLKQEEVFSYSEHTIVNNLAGSVAGAAIFSGGFMPTSLAGWLLLLLLILLILLAFKMVYNSTRREVVVTPPSNGGMH